MNGKQMKILNVYAFFLRVDFIYYAIKTNKKRSALHICSHSWGTAQFIMQVVMET